MKRKRQRHHEVFYLFPPVDEIVPDGIDINFLGVRTRKSFFTAMKEKSLSPSLRSLNAELDSQPAQHVWTNYPRFDEEYFEWIDLLEAVTTAEGHFTMIELGAGWGRWIVNAAVALNLSNGLPYTLIGVEAEPTHFQWMKQHLEDNGVDLNRCQLIEAAVAGKDGELGFYVGDTDYGGPADWYGQSIGGPTPVKAVSLNTILGPLEKVDLIDLDVQGAELEVLAAAAEALNEKVKRIHIETHNREVETGLRNLFSKLGWKNLFDYACCLEYPNYLEDETEWGVIPFQGGVQTWINPRFFRPEALAELNARRIETALGFQLLVQPGDFTSELILKDKIYEAPESELVIPLVESGHICVDAGCHIGYYTCLLAELVGPSGQVYAFDANPWCCQRTRRNLRVNGLSSAEVVHAALGNREETAAFYIAADDQIGLSSLGSLEFHKQRIQVPMMRLEDYLTKRGIQKVRLLKMDVEGAEALVLDGLGRFLENQLVDFILIELNDERLRLLNSSTEQVAASLLAAGYTPWEYGIDNPAGWSKATMVKSRQDCNYLFVSPTVQDQIRIPRIGLSEAVVVARQEARVLKRVVEAKQGSTLPLAGKSSLTTPAQALWNQRHRLASLRPRIRELSAAVNHPSDLAMPQWAQVMAFALDFSPDLIIELGRGMGNSTCCFLEVASHLGGASACRLVSLCLSNSWFTTTLPRLRTLVTPEWLAAGEILQRNIRDYDFAPAVEKAQRVLVLWDAHGFEVAESVLARLLPLLAHKPHRVLMHDMTDIRFETPQRDYGNVGIWKGENAADPAFWLGHIFSRVAQAISIVDFTTRNKLPLHSAVESLYEEFAADPPRLETIRQVLGDEFFFLQSHWFWFSLEEAGKELVFPAFKGIISEEEERAAFEAKLAEREQDVEWLMNSLRNLEEQVRLLRGEKREWEATWQAVQNSSGWRFLEAWRRWRDRIAPKGSARRRFYDSMIGARGR